MKEPRPFRTRRAGSRALLGSLAAILVLVGYLIKAEHERDKADRRMSSGHPFASKDFAEQPTRGLVGTRPLTVTIGGKAGLGGFMRELERMCERREAAWDRLGQKYAALVTGLSEAERRELASRIGRAAACSNVSAERMREIDAWLLEFYERVAFCDGLVAALPADRLQEAAVISSGLSDESLRRRFLERAGQRMGESDWEAAANWLESLPEGSDAEAVRSGVLSVWAEQDPESLLAWSEEHQQAEAAEMAKAGLAREAAGSDPRTASEMAADLPPSTARSRALNYALSRWAVQDIGEVISWAEEVEDTAVKGLALLAATEAWTRVDAEGARAWIATWEDPAALLVQEMARMKVRQFSGISGRSGEQQTLGDDR